MSSDKVIRMTKSGEKLYRLTILLPIDFVKWMEDIKEATGASLGHQTREALKLFSAKVNREGLIAIYPHLASKLPARKEG